VLQLWNASWSALRHLSATCLCAFMTCATELGAQFDLSQPNCRFLFSDILMPNSRARNMEDIPASVEAGQTGRHTFGRTLALRCTTPPRIDPRMQVMGLVGLIKDKLRQCHHRSHCHLSQTAPNSPPLLNY